MDIGETEYYESLESQSLGMTSSDRINTSRQRRKELLIAPEEIQALPDLTAFVSIGHHSVAKSKFNYKNFKKINVAFEQRPELDLEHAVDVMPQTLTTTDIPKQDNIQPSILKVKSDIKHQRTGDNVGGM